MHEPHPMLRLSDWRHLKQALARLPGDVRTKN